MFYNFHQNNSGGSFAFDRKAGISTEVIIEATSREQAIALAQAIGIYFDGVEAGVDCECCGDRWSEPWQEGTEVPSQYGTPVMEDFEVECRWQEDGDPEIFIHYLDGRIVGRG